MQDFESTTFLETSSFDKQKSEKLPQKLKPRDLKLAEHAKNAMKTVHKKFMRNSNKLAGINKKKFNTNGNNFSANKNKKNLKFNKANAKKGKPKVTHL